MRFRANREVAILCNHQKSVTKGFDAQMEKLCERVRLLNVLCVICLDDVEIRPAL